MKTIWYKSANGSDERPSEIDNTSSPTTVYIRKDFVLIPEQDESPAHWEYLETKLSPSEYELYLDNKALRDYLDMIS